MIGGNDIIFPGVGDSAALEACARIVSRYWPSSRFENAITGEKYQRLADIPLGQIRELLAYPDAAAEAAWDSDSPDSPENSLFSVIVRDEELTLVVDNPNTAQMKAILADIKDCLRELVLRSH